MRTIKCPECGQKVIPWDEFPKTLHATITCSTGVIQYYTEAEYQEELKKWV